MKIDKTTFLENYTTRNKKLKIVYKHIKLIKYLRRPPNELLLRIIKENYLNYEYIPSFMVTNEMHKLIVMKDGLLINKLTRPFKEVKYLAIEQNPLSIKHIKVPSLDMKLKAILLNPDAIEFIENPSIVLKKISVMKDGKSIRFFECGNEDLEDIQIRELAVKNNGLAIEFITKPSEDLIFSAIKQNPLSIDLIHNPTEEMCLLAVHINYTAYWKLEKPSEDAFKIAKLQNQSANLLIL